ncbi:MAG TPA: rhomboid family intramembrane serine protease [Rhodanobacteraceae bacterium]
MFHDAPVTLLLIAVTCVVSFLAFKRPPLMQKLVLWPPAVTRQHEYWRLLTSGFVHADLQHLLFNMLTLFFFGQLMERFFAFYAGEVGYVLFYLGGIVVAILPSYLAHRNDVRYASLGASGAVSAVLFGFVLLQPWALIWVFFFPLPAIIYAIMFVGYSIYMDHRGTDNINHSAHLWGAAYGVLFTVAVQPRVVPAFVAQVVHPHI